LSALRSNRAARLTVVTWTRTRSAICGSFSVSLASEPLVEEFSLRNSPSTSWINSIE
jgi:hypothetical protein